MWLLREFIYAKMHSNSILLKEKAKLEQGLELITMVKTVSKELNFWLPFNL